MKTFILSALLISSDPTVELLEELSNAPSASGFEEPVRTILRQQWEPLLSELHTDGLGNLIGTLSEGSKDQPRILLMAHMDEVGFFVREITKDGYLKIDPAGSWLDPVLLSQKWIVMGTKGPVQGMTGAESVHIAAPESVKAISHKHLFIDVGAKSDKEVYALGIRPGMPVTPDTKFSIMNNSQRYAGKAFDDRVGLVVITEVLKRIKDKTPNTVLVAATTQEEVGMRGAEVVAPSTLPDIVINIDIGLARDFPSLFSFKPLPVVLGGGTSCFIYDRTMIPNNKLVELFMAIAKKKQLPFQFDVGDDYGEDGCRLQISGKGVPVINLGIPVRYPHSHVGVVDRRDIDTTVTFIVELVNSLTKEEVENIKSFEGK